MINDVEARLTELAGSLREAQLLRQRLAELDRRLTEQAATVRELRERHTTELRDVERLENLSLARVLVALRGAREAELTRERAEADAARYRVAEAEHRSAALVADRAAAVARLHELADVPARYAAVLEEKDRYLRSSASPEGARLMVLAEERGRCGAELRELAQAVAAADVALGALGEVRRRLDHAATFKRNDNLLEGFLVLTTPHWLDAVAWTAAQADRCLAVLHTELTDVGLARPLGHPPSYAVRPVGVSRGFLESMLANSLVPAQIRDASRAVDQSAGLVAEVRREAAERSATARARWDALTRERDDLLTDRCRPSGW